MSDFRRLMTLARRYHERCEKYDLKVCTGKVISDKIQPRTKKERNKIRVNARFELDWTIALGYFEGFTEAQIVDAATEYWDYI